MALIAERGSLYAVHVPQLEGEDVHRRAGHTQPGKACPACPAERWEHDTWGARRTGCSLSIALITRRPR